MSLQHNNYLRKRAHRSHSGYVLLLALVLVFAMSSVGISIGTVAASKYAKTKRDIYADSAMYAAEAGLSDTVSRFNDDPDFAGYTTAKSYYDKGDLGRASYTTTVVNTSQTQKTVTSTANFYIPNSIVGPNPIATRTVKAIASRNTNHTNYSVFAGPGGITIGSGANNNLFGYNIYSLGKVTLAPGSQGMGVSGYPVNLDVGNVACRQPTTNVFPSPCPSTDQPITIGAGSGGIYGTVCANNQVSSAGITPDAGKGLVASCAPVRNTLSAINRSTIMAAAPAVYDPSVASCNNVNPPFYPPSGTYTGTVNITSCNAYRFPAVMYIKGDLNITGFTQSAPDDALGTQGSIVLVSGKVTINQSLVNYNTALGVQTIVSYQSANSTCSNDPTCVRFTNDTNGWNDTYNSMDVPAVSLENNAATPGAEIIAYFGKLTVTDRSTTNSITGQKIVVNDNSYSVSNNNNPARNLAQARWSIVDYQRTFGP